MSSATPAATEPSAPGQLPSQLESILNQAFRFQQEGKMDHAMSTLESALDEAREKPDESGAKTRFASTSPNDAPSRARDCRLSSQQARLSRNSTPIACSWS